MHRVQKAKEWATQAPIPINNQLCDELDDKVTDNIDNLGQEDEVETGSKASTDKIQREGRP